MADDRLRRGKGKPTRMGSGHCQDAAQPESRVKNQQTDSQRKKKEEEEADPKPRNVRITKTMLYFGNKNEETPQETLKTEKLEVKKVKPLDP
jgi:ribosome-binding ATPase YchF (GTP1/OBG family)